MHFVDEQNARYDFRLAFLSPLGDFLVDDASSGAAQDQWLRPFACGGAGTVLSAGAARATDFAGCAMRYQHACLQSDWVSQGHLARPMCSLPTTRANGPGGDGELALPAIVSSTSLLA